LEVGRKCLQSLQLKRAQYIILLGPLSIAMAHATHLKILALDTATSRISVALLNGDQLCAELGLTIEESRSAHLLASIEFLLGKAGWKLKDLDLVASGTGPGSFTGIRIGLATALGLAQSLSIPFAGISRLDAIAFGARTADGRLGVAMDAQRGQVFYAEYLIRDGRTPRLVVRPRLAAPDDLKLRLRQAEFSLIGDGAHLCSHAVHPRPSRRPRFLPAETFLAADIGRLALRRKRAWRTGAFLQAEALYIRPPDAVKSKFRKS
jgi:tRNA threonylcarbamoyladenosine biosynthesis protein TsaB